MSSCAYPGCTQEAEYCCVVCRRVYCASHTYEQNGYICKQHFNEPVFLDPHAARNFMAEAMEVLDRWIDKVAGRTRQ